MTTPLVDLRGLLRGLHHHNVDFVMFGALAMPTSSMANGSR